MPSPLLTNEKESERLIILVKQFCETMFLKKESQIFSALCRDDISFYSNIASGIGHGIASLENFQVHDLLHTFNAPVAIPQSSVKYEIIEATINKEGGGNVVLKISPWEDKTFHIIADISKEKNVNGTNTQEGSLFLISRVNIFYETTHGQATHGQATHGQATHGQATHGQATHGQAIHGQEGMSDHPSRVINADIDIKEDFFQRDGLSGLLSCYAEENYPICSIDNKLLKILGYQDIDEMKSVGNGVDFLHLDDVEETHRYLNQQLEKGSDFAVELRLRKKDGAYAYIGGVGVFSINDENRTIFSIICIDMKKQQEMLSRATNEIYQLYENIPCAVVRCFANLDCFVEFGNDGFYKLFGLTKQGFDEVCQGNIMNLVYPEDVPLLKESLAKFTANGDTVYLEHRIVSKDKKLKWIDLYATVVVNDDGTNSLYCVCNDATSRHELADALMVTKEKMGAAIEHTGLRYWDYFPVQNRASMPEKLDKDENAYIIENFPEFIIESGAINANSIDIFRSLHARIKDGEAYVEGTILATHEISGKEEWRKIRYTTIFDSEGYPSVAIGTSENIDAYKEIERRLAIAASQTGLDIWTYNLDSKIITQEDDVATIGISERYFENVPEAVIATGVIHKEDIERYRDIYRQLDSGVLQLSCDLRIKSTSTGDYAWTRLFYTVLPESNGGRTRTALGSAIDISEQKLAEIHYEEEIQLWNIGVSDAVMACIVDLSSGLVISGSSDNDFDMEMTNDKTQDFFDLLYTKIIGDDAKHSYSQIFTVENLLRQFSVGARSHALEARIIIENTETIWVSFSITLMKNPMTSAIIGFMTMNDVTEAKISQNFVEELVNRQFDFVLRLNYASNTYKLFASPLVKVALASVECNGVYSEDIIKLLGHNVADDDLALLLSEAKIDRILERSEREGDYNIFFRAKRDGSGDRFKHIHVFLRDEATRSICVGCADITEMHIQEQQRVEALRHALAMARRANESKMLFLASMSHDIRTPMNAIIGMTNLAIEDQENSKQIAESLNVIKSSSEHLLALLNDILEMSRLESGEIAFNKESFSISKESEQVYSFFKGIVLQKNQKISFECVNIEHDQVMSDVTGFNRVLTNLLGNAVKFTPHGGEISMRVEELDMQNEKTAFFRITIKDSGIGIAKDHLESIFEAFNREEKSTVNQIEGTGLGLAIVKALLDSHGGTISVDSDTDKGATFIVEIPMLIDEAITEKNDFDIPKMQIADIDLKAKKILLVEDHPVNVIVATKMLEKMGAVIVTAKNGKEGYETFCNSPKGTFDLVFMDVQMPIMDGYESTAAIRKSEHPEAKTIPIVAMTANAFAEDIRNCKNAGMNCHIAKPITVENIFNCLTQLRIL